ncbi:DUF2917 domain-containing protein [Geomonas terrae]|uniref:DUF2917 domain-containing protein n=1 Tax=Geomonas terrae TaxID=2562681 RepID=A0A4S1C9P2_9BACT|nr:DUF2917 domain-containing protein [Geomonas terrae]TGU69994.1 DUF2917 domain-containing protein [Geomonas terrae]
MDCSLEKGEVLRLGGGPGLRLHCRQGAIWITTGDGRDYVIRAGSCFELEKGCTALTEALASAKLCVDIEHATDSTAISLRTCRHASHSGSLAASA